MANTKVTGDLIASSTIATGNIADNAVTSDKISGITTAHITEGSNLYYTNARARGAVSVSGNALAYNSSTGVITSNFEEAPTFTGVVTASRYVATGQNLSHGASRLKISQENTTLSEIRFYGADTSTAGALRFMGSSSDGSTGDVRMTIDSSGNVGIGTTSPTSLLHLQSASSPSIRLVDTTNTNILLVYAQNSDSHIGTYSNHPLVFDTNSTERMRIKSSGDVLMGNTVVNPASGFSNQKGLGYNSTTGQTQIASTDDVATLVLGRNNATDGSLLEFRKQSTVIGNFGSNTTGGQVLLDLKANQNFRIVTNNTERMRINNSGNVGIGTAAPGQLLHLKSTATGATGIIIENTNNAQVLDIDFWSNAGSAQGRIRYEEGPGAFSISPNVGSPNAMYINYSNNVGIGTSTPGNKLTIASGTGGGSAPDSRTLLHIDKNGEAYISINSPAESFNGIRLNVAGTPKAFMELYDNTAQGKKLNIGTVDARDVVFDTGNQPKMTILSGGNVGIGTTSPNEKLQLAGNLNAYAPSGINAGLFASTAAGSTTIALRSNGVTHFNGGNVGIGTTSPTSPAGVAKFLEIEGSTAGIVLHDNGNDPFEIWASGGNLVFRYNNTAGENGMLLSSTGNLGIGTTSPSNRLHVENVNSAIVYVKSTTNNQNASIWFNSNSGGTQADRWEIGTNISAGTDLEFFDRLNSVSRMVIQNDGKVGIGTISPTRKLDVVGEITHEGLVPKAGAFVDGLVTINKTVSISANTWTSLDISLSNIGGTGTFAVQVYSDAHGSTGGAWYNMYWSGIMSWYHTGVNATDIDEVPLHATGHAMNGNTLEIRTKLHTADGSSYANRCELQIKTANTLSSAPISFRFRKLL